MKSKPCRIEVIAYGSELLQDKVNTNINLIARELAKLGFFISRAETIGDDSAEIESSLRASLKRSDVVITSGGLGPTFDDLTRQIASKVLGLPLLFSTEVLRKIQARFDSVKLAMPAENKRQAFYIRGAQVIINKVGTAPGQIIQKGQKTLIILPGPPKELLPMMEGEALSFLRKKFGARPARAFILHIFGFSESMIDEIIEPVLAKHVSGNGLEVIFGILAHGGIIDVKCRVEGANKAAVEKKAGLIEKELRATLQGKVYGKDADLLETVTGGLLLKRKETVSLAESCTGGRAADKFTNIPGSSQFFKEGVVAYSNETKTRFLGVKPETLRKYGAVSEQTAREMALGLRKRSGSDWAVSTTGIAGPDGGSKEKPVGTVCFGLASAKGVKTWTKLHYGNRLEVKERAALSAINFLRQALLDEN